MIHDCGGRGGRAVVLARALAGEAVWLRHGEVSVRHGGRVVMCGYIPTFEHRLPTPGPCHRQSLKRALFHGPVSGGSPRYFNYYKDECLVAAGGDTTGTPETTRGSLRLARRSRCRVLRSACKSQCSLASEFSLLASCKIGSGIGGNDGICGSVVAAVAVVAVCPGLLNLSIATL